MKKVNFLLRFCVLLAFLLCVKSVQGQQQSTYCEGFFGAIITQDGNDVTVDLRNGCPSECPILLFNVWRLDSNPNNPGQTFVEQIIANGTGVAGTIEGTFQDNNLPSGTYSYVVYVYTTDLTWHTIYSEEFTVGSPTHDMVWTNKTGVSQAGTRLTRNVHSAWDCNSGAASANTIPSGQNGWVEMTVTENWSTKFFGLSNSNPDACRWTIDYSVYFNGHQLRIYESGQNKIYAANCTVGDVVRVERVGTTVYYKKNGATIYTSHKPSSGSLIADVSIKNRHGAIGDSRCSHPASGAKIATTDTEGLVIYPNPATSDKNLNIEFEFDMDKDDATLAIHDINGRLVHQETISVQKGQNNMSIFLDNYAPGVYPITIQAGTRTLNHKLIIQ